MRRGMFLAGWMTLTAFLAAGAVAGEEGRATTWTLKKALKEIDKAAKAPGGITAEVQYEELYRARSLGGEGTLKVSSKGWVRADIGGSSPRTILSVPPYVYVYRPVDESVQTFVAASNPDMLAQYALLGFAPAGSALKKQYDLTLQEEDTLDGRGVLLLDLAPKSKEVAGVISKIRLWIDLETWLPARLVVFHSPSGIQVTVRFLDVTRGDDLPDDLFRPVWPAGTKVIKR